MDAHFAAPDARDCWFGLLTSLECGGLAPLWPDLRRLVFIGLVLPNQCGDRSPLAKAPPGRRTPRSQCAKKK